MKTSTVHDRKNRLPVFTIEGCAACGQKTKRSFQAGDYITKEGGKCPKCSNPTRISLIYAEAPPKS